MATIGLVHVENPLEFGIVITHEDGTIERFLEKPTWGQVFTDTINTGIFVLEPEIFDYIAADRRRRLLQRGVPRAAGRRASRSTAPSPRATGRTSGTLEAYVRAHKDILDGKVEVDIPGFEVSERRVAGRGRRDPSRGQHRRPGRDRRQLPGRGRRPPRRVHRAGHQRRGARRGRARAHASCTTTPTSARACGCAGTVVGRACDLRTGVRCEEGVGARRRVLHRRGRRASAPGVKVYPFKTVEARRRRQHLDRLGVAGRRAACSGATASAGWPTSTSRPSSPPSVAMAYGTTLKKDATVVTSPRLQPVGPHAQAGDDGRAQRRPASTSSDLEVASRAGHPLPRAGRPDSRGGHDRAPGARRPRSR